MLLFYNYDGDRCDHASTHRANVVTHGSKEVLQRWYSYSEQPYLAARMPRQPRDELLPYQPLTVCDYSESLRANVSCRWYNTRTIFSTDFLLSIFPHGS